MSADKESKQPNAYSFNKISYNTWEVLAIDFHGPMSDESELMVLIDEPSKFLAEVKSTASIHVLPKLDSIFSLIVIPKLLKSDNGRPFQGHEFAEFCRKLGVKHRKTTQNAMPKGKRASLEFQKKTSSK